MTSFLPTPLSGMTVPDGVTCEHEWSAWKKVGYTGDWFHPHIIERKCQKCAKVESDEQ
jgi:hypothetical protein